jgi:hypothetical protein
MQRTEVACAGKIVALRKKQQHLICPVNFEPDEV